MNCHSLASSLFAYAEAISRAASRGSKRSPKCTVSELRRLRANGLDRAASLDHMRGRGFTLPAVTEALSEVEGMAPEMIHSLFDDRGDWNDF